ncbi:transmembrane protein 211-like [Amphibalanus amphitrite]|nr:transmembrane protein 211-like [Amphibalanus amphitrite]
MKLRVVRTYTSWPVSAVWTTVSVAVAVLAAYSFLQPAWFVGAGRRPHLAFGALAVCYLNATAGGAAAAARCSPHGPGASAVWQVTAVLCGGGCVMLAVGALVSLAHGFLSTHVWRRKASMVAAYVQAAAVVPSLLGVVLFPLGLGCSFVRTECGPESTVYSSGHCEVAWGLVLFIFTLLVSVYCPILARFTVVKEYMPEYYSNLNYL